jgi:hypothetical protein
VLKPHARKKAIFLSKVETRFCPNIIASDARDPFKTANKTMKANVRESCGLVGEHFYVAQKEGRDKYHTHEAQQGEQGTRRVGAGVLEASCDGLVHHVTDVEE